MSRYRPPPELDKDGKIECTCKPLKGAPGERLETDVWFPGDPRTGFVGKPVVLQDGLEYGMKVVRSRLAKWRYRKHGELWRVKACRVVCCYLHTPTLYLILVKDGVPSS